MKKKTVKFINKTGSKQIVCGLCRKKYKERHTCNKPTSANESPFIAGTTHNVFASY